MKFRLIGEIQYCEGLHHEGRQLGTETVSEEFYADNALEAERRAQRILDRIVAKYPVQNERGPKEFQSCRAELLRVTFIGIFTSAPKTSDADRRKRFPGPFLALNPAMKVIASGCSEKEARLNAHALGCSTPIIARTDK